MKREFISHYRTGTVNIETMTMDFGGVLSKPHNIFTASLIKIPPYEVTTLENESLGGGWYDCKPVAVTRVKDASFLVIRDGVCIGMVILFSLLSTKPTHREYLYPCNEEALKQLKILNIEYKCLYFNP